MDEDDLLQEYDHKIRAIPILMGSINMVVSLILYASGRVPGSYLIALIGMGLIFYNVGWIESDKNRGDHT